jgi:epimerase EvaD
MKSRRLAVHDAVEFSPEVFPDSRGLSASPYQESAFVDTIGRPLFRVAQTLHSTSRRGVVRGVHYTAVPPGGAKYAYCPHGSVLDVVVDIRVGSPTFGAWDAVELDALGLRAVYLPTGVGHAFRALSDDAVVAYLLATEYRPEHDHTLAALDPALGLPLDGVGSTIMSDRDRAAPTLAEARKAGLLPDYARCQEIEATTG